MNDTQKKWLANLMVVVFSLLLFYLSYLIIFIGAVPTRFENSFHTFEGIERIMGIIPLAMGSLLFYLIYLKIKEKF
ncbi:MAG: hypothetical protein ACQESH_03600 [Campylobacterota bacterium]